MFSELTEQDADWPNLAQVDKVSHDTVFYGYNLLQ